MKIALYHNLPSGGARRAMVEMVKGLVEHGHVVDEYCPETAELAFLPLDGIVGRTMVLPFRPQGVARRRTPMLTPYVTSAQLTADLAALARVNRRAAEMIGQNGYDTALTHDCRLTFAPDVLRYLRLPTVHYCHAATSASQREWRGSGGRAGFVEQARERYYAPARVVYPWLRFRRTRSNLRAAGCVLSNSTFAAAELREAFGAAAEVCYLGVDGERFRPMGLRREGFVLSVGAVHHHKGYRFLLEALGRMPEGTRPELLIAANSEDAGEAAALRAKAGELGVRMTVRCVSSEEEMATLYNRAAAFVYAPIREPWGLAAVEALACGTPVVAVAEGGVCESVLDRETGLLTRREVEEFARALGRVLGDYELAERLGSAGAARARSHFTWSRCVEQVEAHLAEAAGMGAGR